MVVYKLVFGCNEIPFQNLSVCGFVHFQVKITTKTFDHHRMFVLAREKIATLINFLE